ncbi:unnamed protein product, partial [Darwinula stevensoni]
ETNPNPLFDRCCGMGMELGKIVKSGKGCKERKPNETSEFPQEEQEMCLLVVETCCVRALGEAQCQRGVDRALASKPCPKGDSTKIAARDASWGGCRLVSELDALRRILGSGGRGMRRLLHAVCIIRTCIRPHRRRCKSISPVLWVGVGNKGNLCVKFLGRLCSHLCIPIGVDSYRCDCPLGHRLGHDEKTCYPEDPSAGCERENPCEQICQDGPNSGIRCLCNPGYQLADDGISCQDVDECVVGVDVCGGLGQACMNTQGSYSCFRPDGSSVAPRDALEPRIPSNDIRNPGQRLECPAGFAFDLNSRTCEDVNECETRSGQLPCKSGFQCRNTIGSFSCVLPEGCPEGYVESSLDSSCLDVDECEAGSDDCDRERESCLNMEGSFTCLPRGVTQCPAGYSWDYARENCRDVDECRERGDVCEAGEVCRNTLGGYECGLRCLPGFRIHPQLKICVDIDECRREMHNCSHLLGEKCVNTDGSFTCERAASICPVGYEFNASRLRCQDVDECLEGACSVVEECVNTPGSFRCQARVACEPGFRLQPKTRLCLDIDECADGIHNCPTERTECANTYGGYACKVLCLPGYRPSPAATNESATSCVDVDECAEGTDPCPEKEECVNMDGSYRCQSYAADGESTIEGRGHQPRCPKGFLYDPVTRKCRDVNECLGKDPCKGGNSSCINLAGGYRCDCPFGFQFTSRTKNCQDVNECQLGVHNCLTTQRCDNTIGSFTCIRITSCGTGYTLNAHNGLCEDDDECELGTSKCKELGPDWECENTQGSFRCIKSCSPGEETNERTGDCEPLPTPPPPSCPSGYRTGSEGSCIDVDECAEMLHDCAMEQTCRNQVGGFTCDCPVGYVLDEKDEKRRSCRDVDECSLRRGQVCSGIDSACVNVLGSYRCSCGVGFVNSPDQLSCFDADECEGTSEICRHICVNTWGSFHCACQMGYVLSNDSRSCNDIDECSGRIKDRPCAGICLNEPGGYSCSCPEGYQMEADGRHCRDVDECVDDPCRGTSGVCVNVGGEHRCVGVTCPSGYELDFQTRKCKRRHTRCIATDAACIRQPLSYSHHFVSLPSNVEFLRGRRHKDLLLVRFPPAEFGIKTQFTLEHKLSRAPSSVVPTSRNNFNLRPLTEMEAGILLVRSIEGPQDVELQLTMDMIQGGRYVGSHVARIFVFVSRYEF